MTTRYALQLLIPLVVLCLLVTGAVLLASPTVATGWHLTYTASEIGGEPWALYAYAPPRRLMVTINPQTAQPFTSTTVYPVLSPDSSHYVVYHTPAMLTIHRASGNMSLFRVSQASDPAWSRDGAQLVYSTVADDGSLAVLPLDEGVSSQITDAHSGVHLQAPCWSPDGEWLAFTASGGNSTSRDILLTTQNHDVDVLPLAADPALDEFDAAWSPDGTRLAYVAGTTRSERHIYTVNADGTNRQQITLNTNEYRYPTWSPDGTWLVYLRYQGTGDWSIVRVAASDPAGDQLVLATTADESPLLWSPGGEWLAYVGQRDNDIYLVRADGRRLVRVTDNDSINVLLNHRR